MALETLTFDYNATFFPLVPDFLVAFGNCSLETPVQQATSESLSVAKKAVDDDEDEFEDDEEDDKEDEDEEDGELEDDDEEEDDDDEEDEDEYEDDDEEEDDDEDDDDVDELQVGR